MESALVRVQDVAAFRGERLVLSGVSMSVQAGGAVLLLGPNGSGKSTLLRVLAGLKRPDAGSVSWPDVAVPVAYLGHADAIKPGLTATENLRFAAAGRPVAPALAALGLAALGDLPARMLSAGQRRRLALARLALSPAPLWLLDEPTLGLDAASLELLAELLATHRAGGGGVVAATHQDIALPGATLLRLG
ncbi:heme ABC exporter ATP-binding protein CcmA [Acidisphaera sp. L21]|uniref:heme ABC exporter ATP-binding protein CcmA n=1 Tax=Acidisphaera sp. L21 TaxID=1641851 RepID=UPI0020B11D06|nr:heme ABC exporter ATP-binding protein CcmA [Acidisphaera sp. L21]